MPSLVSLKGITELTRNLAFKKNTLKARLLEEIIAYFPDEEAVSTVASVPSEELIKKLWDVNTAKEIKAKRKNFSSLKSAINKGLKKLDKQDLNSEGLIINRDNTFSVSEERKDNLIQKLGITAGNDQSVIDLFSSFRKIITEMAEEKGDDGMKAFLEQLDETRQLMDKVAGPGLPDGEKGEGLTKEESGQKIGEQGAKEADSTLEGEGGPGIGEGPGQPKGLGTDGDLPGKKIEGKLASGVHEEGEGELPGPGTSGEEGLEEANELTEDEFEEVDEDEIEEAEELAEDELEEIDEDEIEETEELAEDELEEVDEDEIEEAEEIAKDEFEEIEEDELEEAEELAKDEFEEVEEDELEETEEIAEDEFEEVEEDELEEAEELAEDELEEIEEDELEEAEEIPEDEFEEVEEDELEETEELAEDEFEEVEEDEIEEAEELAEDEFEEVEEDEIEEAEELAEDEFAEVEEDELEEAEELAEDEFEEVEEDELEETEEIAEDEFEEVEEDEIEEAEELAEDEFEEVEEDEIEEAEELAEDELEEVEEDEIEEAEELAEDELPFSPEQGLGQVDGKSGAKEEGEQKPKLLEILSKYLEPEEALKEEKTTLNETSDGYIAQILERFTPKFIKITGGDYLVGSPHPKPPEQAQRTVHLSDFYLGQYPVSNDLFELFIRDTGYETAAEKEGFGLVYAPRFQEKINPANGRAEIILNRGVETLPTKGACWRHPNGPGSSLENKHNHPVVQISRNDAKAFAAWAGKRLPSEEEWEATARSKTGRLFPWGDVWIAKRGNFATSFVGATTPVSRYGLESASLLGLQDLLGNVYEWTSTRYKSCPDKNDSIFILKGGCWTSQGMIASFHRMLERGNHWSNIVGFRCAI